MEAEREEEHEDKGKEDLLTRLKYLQADFENYRKRAEREMREAGEGQVRGLASRLLVVLDELELATKHAGEGAKGELAEGVKMVKRNLESALESAGLDRIQCVGKPFDPRLHEAAERVQGGGGGQDVVVEELRPGYMFRGQVLRPSMVKVQLAKGPAEEEKAIE